MSTTFKVLLILILPYLFAPYYAIRNGISKGIKYYSIIWGVIFGIPMLPVVKEQTELFLAFMGMIAVSALTAIIQNKNETSSPNYIDNRTKEAEEYLTKVQNTNSFPGISVTEISLEDGEMCIRKCINATYSEVKTKKTSSRVGTKVGKIYLSQGNYDSYESFEVVSNGTSYLTNQRIIFVGNMRSLNVKFNEILSREHGPNFLTLHIKNKSKPIRITVDNELIWVPLIDVIPKLKEQKIEITNKEY